MDAAKALDKIQYPFMIKTLNNVDLEETYLNIIKATYDEDKANIILNGEKQNFSSETRSKTRVPTLTAPTQHSTENLCQSNQTVKVNKRHSIQKGRSNIVSVCNNMILYIENPKDFMGHLGGCQLSIDS